jgi:hypothetical protein
MCPSSHWSILTLFQILVQRFTANAKLTSSPRFTQAGGDSLAKLCWCALLANSNGTPLVYIDKFQGAVKI